MRSSIVLAGAAALTSASNLDVAGYKRQDLGYAAINAPITQNCYTYIQHSKYSDVTDKAKFDPERCIRDCEETTAYNKQYLNGRASCRFVNTYILLKDGVSEGQICSMYTSSWDASYATNTGYTDHEGHEYTICNSYSYSNITDPGVPGKDCVGGPYEPQPPVDPSSTQIPSYPSSTKVPTSPSSTFSTVVSTTTTSKASTTSTTSTTSKASTTSQAPTTTTSTTRASTTTSSTSAANPSPAPGGNFRCTGLLSSAQCCQVNALDAASLTCNAPRVDFSSREQFRSICAATGSTASCCLLPILGQALVCQDV